MTILEHDVCGDDFDADAIGGPVHHATAIGVMFHIVEDARWEAAVANLGRALLPGGLCFLGGDFGMLTANVQFHHADAFATWKEHAAKKSDVRRVNKRVRSLAAWVDLARRLGLEVVDLVRADQDPAIWTPENDVLVLQRPAAPP